MSYPVDKGYARARIISETAPDDQAAIWAVGPDEDNITDHRLCYSGTWKSVDELFFGTHRGTSAPSDTRKIWHEVDGSDNLIAVKAYDPALSKWIRLDGLSTRTKTTGPLVANESNKILLVEDGVEVTVPAGLATDFNCAIVLNGFDPEHRFIVTAASGVFLNGVEANTYTITRACTLIPVTLNQYIIIGNLQ